MIIYGSSVSPFVRKALLFAAEKGVEVDNQVSRPTAPIADFRVCSPFGKMPAMRDGDFTLCDSTAIVTYLDALHPAPNLIPLDPRPRARTIWYEEFADTILQPAAGRIVFNRLVAPLLGREGDLAAADQAEREDLPPIFDYLEGVIAPSGYLVEDRFTLADIAVCSPLATLAYVPVRPDPGRWPRLAAYLAGILARPAFAAQLAREQAAMTR
jgi:glutathione S-transferase